MMGAKPLHAESGAKPDQVTSFAHRRVGSRLAAPRARRMIGAIAEFFSPSAQQPAGLYLPLVRIDRDQ